MIQRCRKCGEEAGYDEAGLCSSCRTRQQREERFRLHRARESATEQERIAAGWPVSRTFVSKTERYQMNTGTCEHEWKDCTEGWNRELIQAVTRCTKCGELRIQPVVTAPYITLKVSLTKDRAEELQEPLPEDCWRDLAEIGGEYIRDRIEGKTDGKFPFPSEDDDASSD